MRISRKLWIAGIGGIALAGLAVVIFAKAPQPPATGRRFANGTGAVPVLAAAAARADVPVYLNGVGTIRPLNTVTVRAQVDAKVLRMAFKEGQDVQKGDILVELDPALYKAQLEQAVAKKAQDVSLLDNAKLDLVRFQRLVKTNAMAQQQVDAQISLVQQREAQIQADDAAIDSAKVYVEYTTIRSPIGGRTGIRQVDEGNIVRAADATGIVVITQLHPISVLFSLPQQQLGQVLKAEAAGTVTVEALDSDNRTVTDRGTLLVVDNQVDQVTGTVKMKAEFPNAASRLWPGQFVNVRLLADTLKQSVVVPTAAVQRGPNGPFVYVVRADNTVTVRTVTLGLQDEQQAVVLTGLEPPEQVVTSGFARLTEGAQVTVTAPGTPETSTDPATKPRVQRGNPATAPDGRPERRNRRQQSDSEPRKTP